jgi:curved DNA-binding protein
MARSYYDILGVPTAATADQIKSAYRKLAFKLHPDRNTAPDAAARFAEVQQAYDCLSDPKSRGFYDRFGDQWQAAMNQPFAATDAGARARRPGPSSSRGFNINGTDFDSEDLSSIFDAVFGAQSNQGTRRSSSKRSGKATRPDPFAPHFDPSMPYGDQAPARPEPIRHELRVPFEVAVTGATRVLSFTDHAATPRQVEVRIPSGIDDGAVLRLANAVPAASTKTLARDLLLTVRVDPHPHLRRGEHTETGKGLDLYLDLPLSFAEAALGARVLIPTTRGKVELQIPPAMVSGRTLRLRGQGLQSNAATGDLYVIAKIVPPAQLTPADADLLKALADRYPSPRAGAPWS